MSKKTPQQVRAAVAESLRKSVPGLTRRQANDKVARVLTRRDQKTNPKR